MKTLQLFRDGKELIATDGIMYVDGRLSLPNIKQRVSTRNKQFAANFPHKVADSFAIYSGRIGSKLSSVYLIN